MTNFKTPYFSRDIAEFWRRWHISLSTWLRDYLYVPLGGNRLGPRRTYLNLAIVMLLGGLWHGAAWNFVVWGGILNTHVRVDAVVTLRCLDRDELTGDLRDGVDPLESDPAEETTPEKARDD